MTLREKLIVLRDKAGISQMELANQLDVSRQAVSRWESGDTTPSMDKLKTLAKIYDVSLDWLCNDENEFFEAERVETEGKKTADINKEADSHILSYRLCRKKLLRISQGKVALNK
ncbi:MAG: helix-turn-helix transcriptional regulator [Eubacteriales bacterium]